MEGARLFYTRRYFGFEVLDKSEFGTATSEEEVPLFPMRHKGALPLGRLLMPEGIQVIVVAFGNAFIADVRAAGGVLIAMKFSSGHSEHFS